MKLFCHIPSRTKSLLSFPAAALSLQLHSRVPSTLRLHKMPYLVIKTFPQYCFIEVVLHSFNICYSTQYTCIGYTTFSYKKYGDNFLRGWLLISLFSLEEALLESKTVHRPFFKGQPDYLGFYDSTSTGFLTLTGHLEIF